MRGTTGGCGTVSRIAGIAARTGAIVWKTGAIDAKIGGIGGTRLFGAFDVGYAVRTLRRFQMRASTT